jgi:hypothetical protein
VTASGEWFVMDGARNDPRPLRSGCRWRSAEAGRSGRSGSWPRPPDIWNGDGDDPEGFRRRNAILDDHAIAAGRDPGAIERTVGLPPPVHPGFADEAVEGVDGYPRAATPSRRPRAAGRRGVARSRTRRRRSPRRCGSTARQGRAAVIFDWPGPPDQATLDALAGPIRADLDAAG